MKIFTRILFALFVVFVSVNVYADDPSLCGSDGPSHCCWMTDGSYESCYEYCPDAADVDCYIDIPFEIGAEATFDGDNADESGLVHKEMYYKKQGCDDGIVFAFTNDAMTGVEGYHLCTKYVYPNGEKLPTRTGYTFAGWKLCNTCGDDDTCYTINDDIDLQPIWGENNTLCTKIVAEWCNDDNEVPNGSGQCVCKQGYYSTDSDCTKCPDGKTTSGIGENECKYLFKYDGDKTWTWPANISVNTFF